MLMGRYLLQDMGVDLAHLAHRNCDRAQGLIQDKDHLSSYLSRAETAISTVLASFQLPPPAPSALPDQQTTRQPGRQAPSAKLEQGALAKDAQPTLAMALASLPMPLDPGWDLSTSITTSGSVAVGLAHLVEEENLSVSFGVGTDWKHTQGVAVLSLSL